MATTAVSRVASLSNLLPNNRVPPPQHLMRLSYLLVTIAASFVAISSTQVAASSTSISTTAEWGGISTEVKRSLRVDKTNDDGDGEERGWLSPSFGKIFGSTKAAKRPKKAALAEKEQKLFLEALTADGNKRIPQFEQWAGNGVSLHNFDKKFGYSDEATVVRSDYQVFLQDKRKAALLGARMR